MLGYVLVEVEDGWMTALIRSSCPLGRRRRSGGGVLEGRGEERREATFDSLPARGPRRPATIRDETTGRLEMSQADTSRI